MLSDGHPLQLLHVSWPAALRKAGAAPVLLIHSFPSSAAADWPGWQAALAAIGREVCVVDLPGHGRGATPLSASLTSTSRIVDELDQVLQTLGGSADVVGYSLGARLAWELPRRGHVRRLVLGGIAPVDPFADLNRLELEAFAENRRVPSDAKTARLAAMISRPGLNATGLARCMLGLASEPFTPSASSAPNVPTLFVVGALDTMMQNGLEPVRALVPGASLVRVPGEHRAALLSTEFRAAVLRFLQQP